MTPSRKPRHDEIESREELAELLADGRDLSPYVVKGVDVRDLPGLAGATLVGTIFIGCTFSGREQEWELERRGAYIFPDLADVPCRPWRTRLYTPEELIQGWAHGGYTSTLDFRIFEWFDRGRHHRDGPAIRDALAQRIHDHAIDDALAEVLTDSPSRGVVGIMGGHGAARSAPWYGKVARLAWLLTRQGWMVATGGGPGIMEAANLGAWLGAYAEDSVLTAAIGTLKGADVFDGGEDEGTPEYLEAIRKYVETARTVVERFGEPSEQDAKAFGRDRDEPGVSLAIPTWFYGHEPTNLFARHVAKYFANSIREDGLLAIANGGVVYAPGSAGTLQEVFMDLAQNHYATSGWRSPMVFMGSRNYTELVELLRGFAKRRGHAATYGDLIALFDDPDEVVAFIAAHPPRKRREATPLYELVERG